MTEMRVLGHAIGVSGLPGRGTGGRITNARKKPGASAVSSFQKFGPSFSPRHFCSHPHLPLHLLPLHSSPPSSSLPFRNGQSCREEGR